MEGKDEQPRDNTASGSPLGRIQKTGLIPASGPLKMSLSVLVCDSTAVF